MAIYDTMGYKLTLFSIILSLSFHFNKCVFVFNCVDGNDQAPQITMSMTKSQVEDVREHRDKF